MGPMKSRKTFLILMSGSNIKSKYPCNVMDNVMEKRVHTFLIQSPSCISNSLYREKSNSTCHRCWLRKLVR